MLISCAHASSFRDVMRDETPWVSEREQQLHTYCTLMQKEIKQVKQEVQERMCGGMC